MSISSVASTVPSSTGHAGVTTAAASSSATAASSSASGSATTSTSSSTGSATNPLSALTGSGTVSQTQFLQLLVAQLEHQDPLQPQDSTAFVSQLAQFSSLEQATETNQNLANLASGQTSAERAGMAGLVGRTATARADSLTLAPQNGAPPALAVHLDSPAQSVQVVISDANGNPVRTLNLGARGAGDVATGWNGTDDKGAPLPAGTYSIKVTALGAQKNDLGGYAEVSGVISSLQFLGSGTAFRIGGAQVNPGDILSIQN